MTFEEALLEPSLLNSLEALVNHMPSQPPERFFEALESVTRFVTHNLALKDGTYLMLCVFRHDVLREMIDLANRAWQSAHPHGLYHAPKPYPPSYNFYDIDWWREFCDRFGNYTLTDENGDFERLSKLYAGRNQKAGAA